MEEIKKRLANHAASSVEDGMLIGLGTGSTASYFIQALAKRHIEEGLVIATVSSSYSSERLARDLGLSCVSIEAIQSIDCTFDGADEVDSELRLIKGKGGALLKEKILATNSKKVVILVDESKWSKELGTKSTLAVEVIQFGHHLTYQKLLQVASHARLRYRGDGKPYITENGNFIYDLAFDKPIKNPKKTQDALSSIAGVVEHGLFLDMATQILVGKEDGTIKTHTA